MKIAGYLFMRAQGDIWSTLSIEKQISFQFLNLIGVVIFLTRIAAPEDVVGLPVLEP